MTISESELRAARYDRREREADAIGRIITVRKLRPAEEMRINAFTSELTGSEELTNQRTGEKSHISHRMPLMIASSVCGIDDVQIPFPLNRGELDAIYNRLDREGIDAAFKAWFRLVQSEPVLDEQKELAKNLQGTPPSA